MLFNSVIKNQKGLYIVFFGYILFEEGNMDHLMMIRCTLCIPNVKKCASCDIFDENESINIQNSKKLPSTNTIFVFENLELLNDLLRKEKLKWRRKMPYDIIGLIPKKSCVFVVTVSCICLVMIMRPKRIKILWK